MARTSASKDEHAGKVTKGGQMLGMHLIMAFSYTEHSLCFMCVLLSPPASCLAGLFFLSVNWLQVASAFWLSVFHPL